MATLFFASSGRDNEEVMSGERAAPSMRSGFVNITRVKRGGEATESLGGTEREGKGVRYDLPPLGLEMRPLAAISTALLCSFGDCSKARCDPYLHFEWKI